MVASDSMLWLRLDKSASWEKECEETAWTSNDGRLCLRRLRGELVWKGDHKVLAKVSLADVAKSLTIAAHATRLFLEIAFHLSRC